MIELLTAIAALAAILATCAKGITWLHQRVAKIKAQRVHERTKKDTGEFEHSVMSLYDHGATPRSIAEAHNVRMRIMHEILPETYLRRYSRSGRRLKRKYRKTHPEGAGGER